MTDEKHCENLMLSINPHTEAGMMALLSRSMHPKLNSAGSDAEYINKLSEWQQVVREYEQIPGIELDQTVKTATLMEEAPLQMQMQEHLRLRSEEIGTDYKKVIQAIEGYLRSKKTWNTGPDDMEVDAVVKGKGQPKGKGRSKGKGKGKAREFKEQGEFEIRPKVFCLRQDLTFCQRM